MGFLYGCCAEVSEGWSTDRLECAFEGQPVLTLVRSISHALISYDWRLRALSVGINLKGIIEDMLSRARYSNSEVSIIR